MPIRLRTRAMRGVIVAAAVATGAALAVAGKAVAQQQNFDNVQIDTVKVRDNIYMLVGAGGNTTLFVGDEGAMVVDTQFAPLSTKLIAAIRAITQAPIRYVVSTHMHGDHTGGNAPTQALGAKVIAHENARFQMAMAPNATGLPNLTLEEHMRLDHGEFVLDLYWLGRGHTDGDVVIHLPEQKMIFMGDLFATWDPYVHLIHYAAGGSLREWSRTLERALALPFDTVIPGHGGPTDRAHLETYLGMTVRMQDMVREMIRARRPREDIQKMLETEFGWSGFVTTLGLDGVIGEMQ